MANWRSLYRQRVRGPDDAAAFVAAVGFCTWLPLVGLDFPNLAEMRSASLPAEVEAKVLGGNAAALFSLPG